MARYCMTALLALIVVLTIAHLVALQPSAQIILAALAILGTVVKPLVRYLTA